MRRVVLWIALMAVAGLAAAEAASAVTYQYAYTRWDTGGPAFWGNLTWNGGAGGISWDPDPPSEDNPDLSTPSPELQKTNAAVQENTGQRILGAPSVHTFTSKPLPLTLNLNVSRNIQFEFAFANDEGANACNSRQYNGHDDPMLEIRLRAGNRIVAGLVENDYMRSYIEWWWVPEFGGSPPADPTGYCVSRFALGSEVAVLEEGTVLTLELTFHRQERKYTLGLAGDHRSTIRFPLYTAEEILFRTPPPETQEDESVEEGGGNGAVAVASRPLGLLGLFAGLAGAAHRRGRSTLIVLALVAIAFSGCLSSKGGGAASTSETLRGRLDNTFVTGGDLVSADLGAIVGRIHDDLHIPIPGVHVSLLGFANFTDSDSKGQFKFLGLVPGVYKLRFDKRDYNGFEAEVEVKAGKVSRPSIMLYLSDPTERDRRPHNHDYWDLGEVKREIMNLPLPTQCVGPGGTECDLSPQFHIPFKSDTYASVLPGTSEVEIVLDWNQDTTKIQRLGLFISHNGDSWAGGFNSTIYAPRGPKEPFRIATNWEMADAGHQPYSSWTFHPYVGDPTPPQGYLNAWVDLRAAPVVNAKVVVHKGLTLPLEPGHRDWWAGKTELDVFKNLDGYYYECLWPGVTEPTLSCYGSNQARWEYLQYYGGKIVPPGTGRIDVEIVLNRASLMDMGWRLFYKPANVPRPYDYYSLDGYKEAGAPSVSDTKLTWSFKVQPEETDPEYARVSTWGFVLQATNGDGAWVDYMASLSNLGTVHKNLEVKASAKAFRAP